MEKKKQKEMTLRELNETLKELRGKGHKPYLKGKRGRVKLEFE